MPQVACHFKLATSTHAAHPRLLGVKHDAGHVVEVAAQSIDLPGLRVVHAPELDQAIIRTRDLRNAFGPLGLNHRRADQQAENLPKTIQKGRCSAVSHGFWLKKQQKTMKTVTFRADTLDFMRAERRSKARWGETRPSSPRGRAPRARTSSIPWLRAALEATFGVVHQEKRSNTPKTYRKSLETPRNNAKHHENHPKTSKNHEDR